MADDLILSPETEDDIADGYAWYEKQRYGLGEEFVSCVDAALEAVMRTPEIGLLVHENYRRKLVRRFPYAVYYEYDNNVVTVYCIIHTSRDPAKWRRRLP